MTFKHSVISDEIIDDVMAQAAFASSEEQVGSCVLATLCDRFADPRAVPLEDVKRLLCHAFAAYRRVVQCGEHVAV